MVALALGRIYGSIRLGVVLDIAFDGGVAGVFIEPQSTFYTWRLADAWISLKVIGACRRLVFRVGMFTHTGLLGMLSIQTRMQAS